MPAGFLRLALFRSWPFSQLHISASRRLQNASERKSAWPQSLFTTTKQGMGPGRAGRQWAEDLVMISDGQADGGQRRLVVIGNGQGKDG